MRELITRLSAMRGVSGFEYKIQDKIKAELECCCDEVWADKIGNVIGVKYSGKENAPKLMLEAHADEIGMMITDIDDGGFLSFISIGGIDPKILPSCEVVIHAKEDIRGVIGAKPPHLQTAEDVKKGISITNMTIDTGLSAERVKELVSVGDSVTFASDASFLLGNKIAAKSLDDRASLAALIDVMHKISKIRTDCDVYIVAAVCEEVGSRGAGVAAYGINPDAAIAVDVTHGVTADNKKSAFELGSGAIISIGPNIHPKLQKSLVKTAERYGIKYELEVEGGDTGTDAWIIQTVREGIPTGLLSIPLRYMHTTVETLDIADVQAVSDLIEKFIRDHGGLEEILCF